MLLWKSLPYNHVSLFAGGALVLWRRKTQEIASSSACIVPGRYLWSQSVYCYATGYFFWFLSYSVMYSYVSFLMRLIEIIKTLILLFILLHLYGVAITRIAEGCTPLLWLQLLLPVLWTALKLKIDKKTKCSCYCFCSYSILLIIVNLLHAMMIEWLNKTIQTLCRSLTCKTTTIFSHNNR